MNRHPNLAKLMRVVAQVVAIVLVIAGTVMFLVSAHSHRAALSAVIFFAIASAFAWAARNSSFGKPGPTRR